MKNTILLLLVAILIVGLLNLLVGFGLFGSATPSYKYQVLNAAMMDNVGFTAVAEEQGIEIGEDGKINFPKELADKIVKTSLLPRTISEVETDGSWEFVAVTNDNHYIFRKRN